MPNPRFLPTAPWASCGLVVAALLLRAAPGVAAGDPFAVFGHEFDDTAWVLARAEHPDSLRNDEAVYLHERWSFVVTRADSFVIRHRGLVQILSRAGAEQYGSLNFAYRESDEPPRVVHVRVVGPGGGVREIPAAAAISKPLEGESGVVDDGRVLMVAVPGLQPGDILEIVTEERSGSPLWRSVSHRHLFGRRRNPVREEIVELAAPPALPVTVRTAGKVGSAREEERDGLRTWTWVLRDQAPLRADEEEDAPTIWETGSWVGFSSGESWAAAGRDYGAWFWPQAGVTGRLRGLARDLTRGARTRDEKAAALFAHVSGKLGSMADERGIGSLVPTPADSVVERGFGDCKDRVVLLIALLEAAGIEAAPALLRSAPNDDIATDFVSPESFDHMIAWLPQVRGGVFCDPALGDTCLAHLPHAASGRLALLVPRDGEPELRRTPATAPESHGYDLTADVRPLGGTQADVIVRCTLRGRMAMIVHAMLAYSDTSYNDFAVDRWLGFGLWSTCERRGWRMVEQDCDGLTLEAAYRDTAWAEVRHNSLQLRYLTEVADPGFSYPDPKDRRADVVVEWPFHDTVTIRLRDGGGWTASAKLAPISLRTEGYEGGVSVAERNDAGGRFVEVRQEFTLRTPRMAPADYRAFHRDWVRMRVCVAQPYRYDRELDTKRLATIEEYARDNPMDAGFALEAAKQVLGSDGGGRGPAGDARRAIARRLVAPALHSAEAGGPARLLLAELSAREGDFVRADSLMTACLERHATDPVYQRAALRIKSDLGDRDAQIDLTRQLVDAGAGELRPDLVQLLYEAGRDDEARAAERRMLVFGGSREDTTAIRIARCLGFARSRRAAEADSALARLAGRLTDEVFSGLKQYLLAAAGRLEEAVVLAEESWHEDPLNGLWCNNLAWYCAMLGRNLEQAEDLARAAAVLSDEDASRLNTLGAVCARRGKWDEARALFERAYRDDDSPEHRAINGFFLGLCDWQAGRKAEARQRWLAARGVVHEPPYDEWPARALELDEQGKSPLGACFAGME